MSVILSVDSNKNKLNFHANRHLRQDRNPV